MVSGNNRNRELSDTIDEDAFFHFKLMTSQQFMDYVEGNPKDPRAYEFLFESSDGEFLCKVLNEAERRGYYFFKGLE